MQSLVVRVWRLRASRIPTGVLGGSSGFGCTYFASGDVGFELFELGQLGFGGSTLKSWAWESGLRHVV